MPNLSVTQFAKLCGVSRQSINKGAPKGLVVKSPDGTLDTENVVNATYIAQHRGHSGAPSKPRPHTKKTDTPDGDTVSPHDEEEAGGDDPFLGSNVDIRLKEERILFVRSQREKNGITIGQAKNELVPLELVGKMWSKYSDACKTNIVDWPRRTVAKLYAIAVSEGQQALELALEAEMEQILRRLIDAATSAGLGE